MKSMIRKSGFLLLISAFLFAACRSEETELIEPAPEDTLEANANVAVLMQRTAMNDGSKDNIIDQANCFTIQFPVTVHANGMEITVDSEEDFESIEDIFDEFEDDIDVLDITFPVTVTFSDFSETVIDNIGELNNFIANCNGENEADDDIECIDFQYPVTVSIFNPNNEIIDNIVITDDNTLYDFIDDLDEDDIVSLNFPITLILSDGMTMVVNNLDDLEDAIESAIDDCDEDDDYDFNDDDCDGCTPDELTSVLTGCTDWFVTDLRRNDIELEDMYAGYLFNFAADGTLTAEDDMMNMHNGTWESSGAGNDITVIIDIPALPDFNNTWNLHEIQQEPGDAKVRLRVGDENRLRFESNCGS